MKTHAQVVVIGGGVMGCSLAYHLTQLGLRDVVLLEKNELTAGSTWHAAGLCTHFAHNLTIMHMRAYSVRLYGSELANDTGRPVGFHPAGALRITSSADRMDEFRHVRGLARYAGIELQLLSPPQLRAIYPLADLSGLLGALYEPHDGYVDPSQATHAMAAGARARGAAIYRHTAVERLERTHEAGWIVHTGAGSIRCEVLVNAAGTWAREIGAMMGIDLPVVPMLHQYLVTERSAALEALARELPIIRDPEQSWYVRQEGAGFILGPYERDGRPWSVDGVPPDFGMELLPPDLTRVEGIIELAMKRIPALTEAGVKTIVNGPITFTPDANPLIGPAAGLTNAWLLTGSSMGVMEGGGAGKFLAEWIVGGEPPMDALAVDPRRFGPWADRDYRVAKAIESFAHQFAIHYPFEERPAARPKILPRSHATLQEQGAVFGFVNGWERANWFDRTRSTGTGGLTFRRPHWFEAVAQECRAVRDCVGLTDLSHLAKFELTGPDATALMAGLGANCAPTRDGGIGLIHALTARGGVRSEFTVTRLAADHYYLTSAAAAELHDLDLMRGMLALRPQVKLSNETRNWGVLAIAGPQSRRLLQSLTDTELDNEHFPFLCARELRVAGHRVRALRLSYVGELGWELHCPNESHRAVFDAVCAAVRALDGALFGAFAMNSLRLEKAFPAYGLDLSTERTPLEAGLGRFVRLQGRQFEGRAALMNHEQRSGQMRLVQMAVDGEQVDPFYGHAVCCGREVVGLVTSGAFGHRVGRAVALAYVKREVVEAGADLRVQILDVNYPAHILSAIPYDATGVRPRSA
jgi:dimethylglycine dehydrogenase